MEEIRDFLLDLLSQFAGGPGPAENNLVRFGLPTIFWAVLLYVAWSRQRHHERPRESLLVWGFALGLVRELFLFVHTAVRIITDTGMTGYAPSQSRLNTRSRWRLWWSSLGPTCATSSRMSAYRARMCGPV